MRSELVVDDKDRSEVLDKFAKEFGTISKLSHMNVVKYQGVAFLSRSEFPVLVMEKLKTNLHDYLMDTSHAHLSKQTKIRILYGVANGLLYLHVNNVSHRDLTARNVLLDTELTPKITDLGNSCIDHGQSPTSAVQSRTAHPGTLYYMPPEAQGSNVHYNNKIDVFSFGHLALFVCTQENPTKLLDKTSKDRYKGLVARSELERRHKYFSKIPENFKPLTDLMKKCLEDDHCDRPPSDELLVSLREIQKQWCK